VSLIGRLEAIASPESARVVCANVCFGRANETASVV
jgi:hypothetical protein